MSMCLPYRGYLWISSRIIIPTCNTQVLAPLSAHLCVFGWLPYSAFHSPNLVCCRCLVLSQRPRFLWPCWTEPARLLCPCGFPQARILRCLVFFPMGSFQLGSNPSATVSSWGEFFTSELPGTTLFTYFQNSGVTCSYNFPLLPRWASTLLWEILKKPVFWYSSRCIVNQKRMWAPWRQKASLFLSLWPPTKNIS